MRLHAILNELAQANDYITVSALSQRFSVSIRTIQNDLSYLIRISKYKGFQLNQYRGKGYLLEILDQIQFSSFCTQLSEESILDSNQRTEGILATLVLQTDYISMEELADSFRISRTSVKKEIQAIEKEIKSYPLKVEKKSHYGVRLEKTSPAFLMLVRDLFAAQNEILLKESEMVLGDFDIVYKTLIREFGEEGLVINYEELKEIYTWIQSSAFVACRKLNETSCEPKNDKKISRLTICLNQWVEKVYGVSIGNDALKVLDEMIHRYSHSKKVEIKDDQQLQKDIDDFLETVDESNGTDFNQDDRFKTLLFHHVSLLIDRFYQKISYKNALLDEISIRYPRVFNMAISFGNMLHEKYAITITHDEVAFIATHFATHYERKKQLNIHRFQRIAVVCSSGGGSAFMIKMQIESLFSKENVETFSFLEMEKLREFDPDIIFTIMPLSEEFKVPVIYIHELLDDSDLLKIKQLFEGEQIHSASISDIPSTVNTLFTKECFEVGTAKSYMQLLEKMADELEQNGYGDPAFKQNILERERYMSTIYLNGVAIPHPIEMCARKNAISTYILSKELEEKGKKVNIVFMICLTKQDYQSHSDITKLLYLLMKDEKRLQKILKVNSFEEMMVILREMEGLIR